MMADERTALLHPLHGLLLAFPVSLFPSALASDVTYLRTAVVQWSHFSAWLLAGAQLFASLVLLWAIINVVAFRRSKLRRRAAAYLVAVATMWAVGLVNSFHHSQDAWSSVGAFGLVLSIATAMLAFTAGWIGYSTHGAGDVR